MLFTSLNFLLFLPVVLAMFAALPERWRWAWLLLASYAFYGSFGLFNLVYLGAVTAVAYSCGRGIGASKRKVVRTALLTAGLVAILGSLTAFKFYDFVAGEIERLVIGLSKQGAGGVLPRLGLTTPVGYSFYAFMAASYLIDVHVGRLSAEPKAGRLALYVAFFPKILAGPIERATSFLPQVAAMLRAEPERILLGSQLIGWGLFKKVAIADNLAPLVDHAFGLAAFAPPMELLLSVYFFAFQIYCDFSGYTDIAIGVALLFGVQLMENFRRPYLSRSTGEFWAERWHISLGRWFRDYLYFPLGGSRAGQVRHYANLMAVFVISGLWHAGLGYGVGWTFLVWGALNGAYQWVGLATAPILQFGRRRLPWLADSLPLHLVRVFITFHLIAIGWVFFRAKSIGDALTILRKIWFAIPDIPALLQRYPFSTDQYLGIGLIVLLSPSSSIRRPGMRTASPTPRCSGERRSNRPWPGGLSITASAKVSIRTPCSTT